MDLRPATGEVLEVAIGSGRNLPYYPTGIRLTGIDFSAAMLELARRRADQLGRTVELRLGDAQAFDLPDASFDTVVGTLSLCAIPDERQAVAEMQRVLRPGGRLLLLDHVVAAPRPARAVQWLLERLTVPLGVSICSGARCGRCRRRGSGSSSKNGPSSGSWNGWSLASRPNPCGRADRTAPPHDAVLRSMANRPGRAPVASDGRIAAAARWR